MHFYRLLQSCPIFLSQGSFRLVKNIRGRINNTLRRNFNKRKSFFGQKNILKQLQRNLSGLQASFVGRKFNIHGFNQSFSNFYIHEHLDLLLSLRNTWGSFPLRAWNGVFFVSFIIILLCLALKCETKKKQ